MSAAIKLLAPVLWPCRISR